MRPLWTSRRWLPAQCEYRRACPNIISKLQANSSFWPAVGSAFLGRVLERSSGVVMTYPTRPPAARVTAHGCGTPPRTRLTRQRLSSVFQPAPHRRRVRRNRRHLLGAPVLTEAGLAPAGEERRDASARVRIVTTRHAGHVSWRLAVGAAVSRRGRLFVDVDLRKDAAVRCTVMLGGRLGSTLDP
jgi:hypothetical protein